MEQACDALRKEIVNAMRAGQVICINFGKLFADFNSDLAYIPWDDIFSFDRFREQDIHERIVKPDEMYMIGM